MQEWIVDIDNVGERADVGIANAMAMTRAEVQRLLESGAATVNDKPVKPSYKLREGDRVVAERPAPVPTEVTAEDIPLAIVYEDSDLIVINKPRGMVVHPAPGSWTGTLVNAILAHADDLSGIGGELRPGIVHRLDKDTSGLLVIAKNDVAHQSLQAQIQAKTAERRYYAIVWGVPQHMRTVIDAPIGRNPSDRKKMAVVTDPHHHAREAVTEVSVLETYKCFSFIEAKLQTGRTHQIRVHCAYIAHPVVGDPLYGGSRKLPSQDYPPAHRAKLERAIVALDGQALHAYSLSFTHPRTDERMTFQAPLPPVMDNLLIALREANG